MESKKIRIYSSLEEQKEAEIAYALSISPEQRFREAVILIRKVYGWEEGRKSEYPKHINIIHRG
ncbi:MAG TPA: hypothetical protein VNB90_14010 [Cytophagaceae bacterium]|jgi:hypothetical protein|nr:hypothetical protein [Cytophagaceae bacterium]